MSTQPKNLPAEERRAATVAAVIELAARQNPTDITTAAIAQHMGLTQGALFRHFSSKDALWQAVMEWVADKLLHNIDQAARGIDSPLAALEAMFLSHVEFVSTHPGVPRMMFGELQRGETTRAKEITRDIMRAYRRRIHQHIVLGKEAGELQSNLEEEVAVTLFLGIVQGLLVQALFAENMEIMRSNAPRVFAIYRRGIQAEL